MFNKSEAIRKLEEALTTDANLRDRFEAALKKIADERLANSDGEAMVKAAAELGFKISIEEMERLFAAMQELDDEELDEVSGGTAKRQSCRGKVAKHAHEEDENGHDGYCDVVWHCAAITLHTKTDSKNVACWNEYLCHIVNN